MTGVQQEDLSEYGQNVLKEFQCLLKGAYRLSESERDEIWQRAVTRQIGVQKRRALTDRLCGLSESERDEIWRQAEASQIDVQQVRTLTDLLCGMSESERDSLWQTLHETAHLSVEQIEANVQCGLEQIQAIHDTLDSLPDKTKALTDTDRDAVQDDAETDRRWAESPQAMYDDLLAVYQRLVDATTFLPDGDANISSIQFYPEALDMGGKIEWAILCNMLQRYNLAVATVRAINPQCPFAPAIIMGIVDAYAAFRVHVDSVNDHGKAQPGDKWHGRMMDDALRAFTTGLQVLKRVASIVSSQLDQKPPPKQNPPPFQLKITKQQIRRAGSQYEHVVIDWEKHPEKWVVFGEMLQSHPEPVDTATVGGSSTSRSTLKSNMNEDLAKLVPSRSSRLGQRR